MKCAATLFLISGSMLALLRAEDAKTDTDALAFFETRIRPVLARECYECHGTNNGKRKNDLALDTRAGARQGGKSGPAVVPGDPAHSLLLQVIKHEHPDFHMPKNGPKLDEKIIADFTAWIENGAIDPRNEPPATAAQNDAAADWSSVLNQRKKALWSFQPITDPPVPEVPGLETQPPHPVDRFLQARQQAAGLKQNPPADRAVLLRRLSFLLNGLPPGAEETERLGDWETRRLGDSEKEVLSGSPGLLVSQSPSLLPAYQRLVDRLLNSPAYGETWGRHWLDWFRYADTHGSEGDPAIPHAWRYRDYVIRAFNADVFYPQMVRESLAGDLLANPRLDPATGQNESLIGAAELRMVLHAFSPTDSLDEFVTFTDNQIDVATKAFFGLTVSCARCHNHKFDPVSQEDYYALFGVFGSAVPALACPDAPTAQAKIRDRMREIKVELRTVMAAEWKKTADDLPALLPARQMTEAMKKEGEFAGLSPWFALKTVPQEKFVEALVALQKRYMDLMEQDYDFRYNSVGLHSESRLVGWPGGGSILPNPMSISKSDFTGDESLEAKSGRSFQESIAAFNGGPHFRWFASGPNFKEGQSSRGDFSCAKTGDSIIATFFADGFYTHGFSDKDRGIIMSERFKNEGGKIWVRVAGHGGATARYAVNNFPRTGLIYPKLELKSDLPQWQEWDVNYWKDEMMHLELTTAADAPVEAKPENAHSWFGITDAYYVTNPQLKPVELPLSALHIWFGVTEMKQIDDLSREYQSTLRHCVEAWEQGKALESFPNEFLAYFLRHKLLPNTLSAVPAAKPLMEEYRRLEQSLPFPTRVPGMMETEPFNQPLYVKGDLKHPAAEVPRRFLEALDPTPFSSQNSGRLQLAEAILAKTNPLTDRVIVNRVWLHLFGRGLVATPDNFGKLGSAPSHPELLDHLATWFRAHNGSIKELIRYLVTTEAFQASSEVPALAAEKDPNNELLTHFSRHRLPAEAIRDTMLSLSGKMQPGSPGEGAGANEPFRSIYLKLVRNNLPPLLTAFDFPPPVTTRGSRDSTNVPAQSLALLNDPQVEAWARDWAGRGKREAAPEQRVAAMFRAAFTRSPAENEVKNSLAFLESFQQEEKQANEELQRQMARQAQLDHDLDSMRGRVVASRKPVTMTATVEPYAEWDFEKDAHDLRHGLPLQLQNGAKIVNGALVLDGVSAYAVSDALPLSLEEKTLEAWVQLDGLNQAGGGVMTIQNQDGSVFDAIVYGERESGQWMAGSEFYLRTQSFKADGPEQQAAHQLVRIALVWKKDGSVTAWREGKPYGEPIQNKDSVSFSAGQSLLVLGCRHLPPSGNRALKGRIARARLYDRALTEKELQQTSALEKDAVTDENVLAVLSPAERESWAAWQKQSMELAGQLAGKTVSEPDPERAWAALAHALMNTKELIYLR